MSFERVKLTKRAYAKRVLGFLWKVLTYYTPTSRRDRELTRIAMLTVGIAKKALDQRIKAKNATGELRIAHGGTIEAPPFPPRGSLLTDEERKLR